MKKRFYIVFLTFAVCLMTGVALQPSLAEPVAEEGITSGDYFYHILEDGTAEILRCSSKEENLVLPETIDGLRVTSIAGTEAYSPDVRSHPYRFIGLSCKTITIPNSITHVGNNPFINTGDVEEIIVADNHPTLFTIDGVLYDKTKMELICLPPCSPVEDFIIPDGIRSIGEYGIYHPQNLRSVTLPETLEAIKSIAFSSYKIGQDLIIPQRVQTIETAAFVSCNFNLLSVPGSVKIIPKEAFMHCKAESLYISEGVEEIETLAFRSSKISKIYLPGSIKSIGKRSFLESDTVFSVIRGSYAEVYCDGNGFLTEYRTDENSAFSAPSEKETGDQIMGTWVADRYEGFYSNNHLLDAWILFLSRTGYLEVTFNSNGQGYYQFTNLEGETKPYEFLYYLDGNSLCYERENFGKEEGNMLFTLSDDMLVVKHDNDRMVFRRKN